VQLCYYLPEVVGVILDDLPRLVGFRRLRLFDEASVIVLFVRRWNLIEKLGDCSNQLGRCERLLQKNAIGHAL
jgi:hypothetical protein